MCGVFKAVDIKALGGGGGLLSLTVCACLLDSGVIKF